MGSHRAHSLAVLSWQYIIDRKIDDNPSVESMLANENLAEDVSLIQNF